MRGLRDPPGAADQLGLALVIGSPDRRERRLAQPASAACACSLELELIGLRLDREQLGALLDEGAVLIVDRLQEALHPRDEVDALDRRGVAGGLDVARHGALQLGAAIVHLGQRRRQERVLCPRSPPG